MDRNCQSRVHIETTVLGLVAPRVLSSYPANLLGRTLESLRLRTCTNGRTYRCQFHGDYADCQVALALAWRSELSSEEPTSQQRSTQGGRILASAMKRLTLVQFLDVRLGLTKAIALSVPEQIDSLRPSNAVPGSVHDKEGPQGEVSWRAP